MKTQVYSYYFGITGLFGRNRKVKFDTFELASDLPLELSEIELRKLVDLKIASLKVKGSAKIKVSVQPLKLSHDNGFTVREFMIFTSKTLISETIG